MNPIEKQRATAENELSLRQIVHKLLINYQPIAVKQKSFFVNDVPEGLTVVTDANTLSSLLGSLLCMTARLCRDTCIKISAKAYHDVVLMHIKDTSTFNSYAVLSELQHLQLLAGKIGGYVELTSQRKKETTIAFSFINNPRHQYLLDRNDTLNVKREIDSLDLLRA